jgi:hypothetical protein
MILRLTERLRVPPEEVRDLILEGFHGVGKQGVEVHVVANRSRWVFSGKAWPEPPKRRVTSAGTEFLVEISMPRAPAAEGFPYRWRYTGLKTAPRLIAFTWQERLVALAAHEAYHVKQFRLGMRKSEVAAERWAVRALERHRELAVPSMARSATSGR